MDDWFADKLAELKKAGLADETIVFFYSDHGAGMPGCKKWVWESGLRVPLIVRIPKKFQHLADGKPASRSDRLVSFVDFAPTALSLAGVEIGEHMQGEAFLGSKAGEPREYVYGIRDRMAERYDTVRLVRDHKYQYMRNYVPHLSWSQRVGYTEQMPTMKVWRQMAEEGKLQGPAARYFAATKPREELYDVQADPHQIHNLAGEEEHAGTLQRMRAECLAWQRRSGDLGMLPEYEMRRRAADRTPYDIAFDLQANPLPELIETADLANRIDPKSAATLAQRMTTADDGAIRWWAARGLVALAEDAAPVRDALVKALKDPAPNVRIAAAESLCSLGEHDIALPMLIAELKHDAPQIRLRAANVVDRLDAAGRPALPALKKAADGWYGDRHVGEYVGRLIEYVPSKFPRQQGN